MTELEESLKDELRKLNIKAHGHEMTIKSLMQQLDEKEENIQRLKRFEDYYMLAYALVHGAPEKVERMLKDKE